MHNDLEEKLESGYLLFYGYSHKHIPDQVKKNYASRMKFYFKQDGQRNFLTDEIEIYRYSGYQDTGWETSDVVFFDQDAVKSLLIGYPSNAKYVLINFANIKYIHWVIIGFLRRILIRQVRFLGFKKLTHNGKSSHWVVLGREQLIKNNDFFLSREVGIEGFLNHLKMTNTEYVVPRFFETLPQLHRKGGDLDLLVSDKDEKRVKEFLLENEGDIRIDVWSVSRPNYHGITYMPPYLAKEVIDESIEGNACARIPKTIHALNCMIFHVLYHKGFQSGIPSKFNTETTRIANNDYLSFVKKYAGELNLEIDFTMEGLDQYMLEIGWRPALDTLAKIAQWNEWVRIYHFNEMPDPETDLFALILKSEAVKNGLSDVVLKECDAAGYEILSNRILDGEIQAEAIKKIRGGVWNDGLKDDQDVSRYHPAQIFIILNRNFYDSENIQQLKEVIRKKIDTSKTSYIHSTDNDIETWSYINICIPDEEEDIKNMVDMLKEDRKKLNSRFSIRTIRFKYSNLKSNIKSFVTSLISH